MIYQVETPESYIDDYIIDPSARAYELKEQEERNALWNKCATDRRYFIDNFVYITNPKAAASGIGPTKFLFKLRPRQVELLKDLEHWLETGKTALVPKSREEGASWLACAFAVHGFLFIKHFSAGFGSRDQNTTDSLDDMDSLLEKCRFILRNLPFDLQPQNPKWRTKLNYGKLTNTEMSTQIKGEVGQKVGRGGRNTIYFYDEFDWIPYAKKVHTALNENAHCKVFISSVAGYGTYMHEMEESGDYPITRLHWKDNPDKNHFEIVNGQKVYPYEVQKRADYGKANPEGYAQEIDMDRSASQKGALIPVEHIEAAFDLIIPLANKNATSNSGLDVSNDRGDNTTYANRNGSSIMRLQKLHGKPLSPQVKNLLMLDAALSLSYDETGVGAHAVGELEADPPKVNTPNSKSLKVIVQGFTNNSKPSEGVLPDRPQTPANVRFKYAIDELWWQLKLRLERSYMLQTGFDTSIDPAECISFAHIDDHEVRTELKAQLARVLYETETLSKKIRINKTGNSSISPDYAEAILYTYVEIKKPTGFKIRSLR